MAIAFSATSNPGSTDKASSLAWNHVIAGSNKILVVCVACNPKKQSITAVTYNSVALTYFGRGTGTYRLHELWYLLNPVTGTKEIAVTFSASDYCIAGAASFTGVSGIDNVNGTYQTDVTTATLNISGVSGDYLAVAACQCWKEDLTAGSGETERWIVNADRDAMVSEGCTNEDGAFSWTLDEQTTATVGARPVPYVAPEGPEEPDEDPNPSPDTYSHNFQRDLAIVDTASVTLVGDEDDAFIGAGRYLYLFSNDYKHDNDQLINSYWRSKRLDFTDQDKSKLSQWKTIDKVQLTYVDRDSDTPVTIYVSSDGGENWVSHTRTIGTGDDRTKTVDFYFMDKESITGHMFTFKIESTSSDKHFEWNSLTVWYEARGEYFEIS